MRIVILKWLSIVALLLAVLFWNSLSAFQLALNLFVSMAAAVVAVQALRARKSGWLVVFLAVTIAFGIFAIEALTNPVAPRLQLSGPFGVLLVGGAIAAFLASLVALKSQTLFSMASITDRTPGSQSL